MRSAIIKNGKVVNIIVGQIGDSIECDNTVKKGDNYIDGKFISIEPVIKQLTIIEQRKKLYGTALEQIEYAVENGFEALITRNMAIKESLPKETE